MREHIRVRVVDKRLEGGALYNKKGSVVDVSGAQTLSLRLDDPPGRLVEGLSTSAVETVLPKQRGAPVLILAGEHKLRRGQLYERRTKEARAVVRLTGDFSLVEVSFDDAAEWVGPDEEFE